jgi:hypothetical protein
MYLVVSLLFNDEYVPASDHGIKHPFSQPLEYTLTVEKQILFLKNHIVPFVYIRPTH